MAYLFASAQSQTPPLLLNKCVSATFKAAFPLTLRTINSPNRFKALACYASNNQQNADGNRKRKRGEADGHKSRIEQQITKLRKELQQASQRIDRLYDHLSLSDTTKTEVNSDHDEPLSKRPDFTEVNSDNDEPFPKRTDITSYKRG